MYIYYIRLINLELIFILSMGLGDFFEEIENILFGKLKCDLLAWIALCD